MAFENTLFLQRLWEYTEHAAPHSRPTKKGPGMSLTSEVALSQSALREKNKTFFSKGGYVVTYPFVIPARPSAKQNPKKRQEDLHVLGVLLEESPAVKASCYHAVFHRLREDARFRELVTESREPVTFDQVIDAGGFGVFTMTDPVEDKYVRFDYFPRVGSLYLRPAVSLGTCGLGRVVPTTVESMAS